MRDVEMVIKVDGKYYRSVRLPACKPTWGCNHGKGCAFKYATNSICNRDTGTNLCNPLIHTPDGDVKYGIQFEEIPND